MKRLPPTNALAFAFLIVLALPAQAGVAELLLKKGMITQEEYRQLKEEAAAEAAASRVVVENLTPVAPEPAPAPAPAMPAVGFTKGFNATSIDGTYSVQLGTLMQLDAAGYRDDSGLDNNAGTEMRRGRLYMQGTVLKDWQYKFEMEVFGSAGTEVTDAYVRYNGFLPFESGKPLGITVGNFKIPFGFEQMMADKDLSLMERSLSWSFLKARSPGVMLSSSADHWTAAAMVYGEQLTSNTSNPQQDEGVGASVRATWAPLIDDGATFHLGASAQYQEPTQRAGGATLRYSARPESRMTSLTLVDTGTISGEVDNLQLLGLETAATLGPVTLNGEYIDSAVSRAAAGDLDFNGWYAQAAWLLSGELRGYNLDSGVFKPIQPLHPVSSGGIGAWELTARYSQLDLNDGDILGGKERNATLGLGWYANNFVRVSGNWIHVMDVDGGKYDGKDMDAFQMRLQFAY